MCVYVSTLPQPLHDTVYWEIFAWLYFHEFCSVAKLNFAKYCHATPFMLPHGSFVKIYFVKLLKLPFLRKFSDMKISQYTVVTLHCQLLLTATILFLILLASVCMCLVLSKLQVCGLLCVSMIRMELYKLQFPAYTLC